VEEKGFFASLFDLSFTEFVTTRLVPVLFVLSIVVAAIYTLFLVFAGFKGGVITGIGALGASVNRCVNRFHQAAVLSS
jgi:hypothetical protein